LLHIKDWRDPPYFGNEWLPLISWREPPTILRKWHPFINCREPPNGYLFSTLGSQPPNKTPHNQSTNTHPQIPHQASSIATGLCMTDLPLLCLSQLAKHLNFLDLVTSFRVHMSGRSGLRLYPSLGSMRSFSII
jgi:hypothetical protein